MFTKARASALGAAALLLFAGWPDPPLPDLATRARPAAPALVARAPIILAPASDAANPPIALFVGGPPEAEAWTIAFADEDHPLAPIDLLHDPYRGLLRHGRVADLETVTRRVIDGEVIWSFDGTWAGEQGWGPIIALHHSADIPEAELSLTGGRPRIAARTWNHMLGAQPVAGSVAYLDLPVFAGDRAAVEALFARSP